MVNTADLVCLLSDHDDRHSALFQFFLVRTGKDCSYQNDSVHRIRFKQIHVFQLFGRIVICDGQKHLIGSF